MSTELARWQFATTSIHHFLFVPVTIGLAFLTAALQTAWHRSGNPEQRRLTLSLLRRATFLMLKTSGTVREGSAVAARGLVWPALTTMLGFMIWTRAVAGDHFPSTLIVLDVIAVLSVGYLVNARRDRWTFAASAAAIATSVVSIFVGQYPNVMVSSTNVAYNLTVSNSSLATYALTVMALVAVIFALVVLLYQGWSFHLFRSRVGATQARLEEARPGPPPAPAVAPAAPER